MGRVDRNSTNVTFGLFLNAIHPVEVPLEPRLSEHREQVRLAQKAGFTSVVAGQHLLTYPVQMPAPIPFLSSMIDVSGDMRLVLGILLLPLLHPVGLAEEVATLDLLSGGRIVFGAGLGYRPPEYAAFGVDTKDRVGRFKELLRVVQTIWTADKTWSFQGEYYRFDELPAGLKPTQRPHPPLWFAADVDNAVRRAAEFDAAWYINPRAELAHLERQLPVYQQALAEHGREMPETFPIRREAFLAPTDEQARTKAVRYLERMLSLYKSWGQYEVMPGGDEATLEFGEDDIPDTYLVGSPERVIDTVEKYVETLGVNHFVLRMQWPGMSNLEVMKSIEMVGEHLIPHFS